MAKRSGGLVQLARCDDRHNPERDAQRVLVNKLGLALDVKISYLPLEKDRPIVPHLRLRDWAQWIVDKNLWFMLSGLTAPDESRSATQWKKFWDAFRDMNPNHSVFTRADRGDLDLRYTAGILIHGDEGRSRRRSAIMVLSWHSILGRGTGPQHRSAKTAKLNKMYDKLLPNFMGHSYTTRYLLACLNKAAYNFGNEYIFDEMMEVICGDLEFMATTGVRNRYNQRYWMVMLHICGDWPFLGKSGNLTRTFNNITKKAGANRREAPKGICHICRAGQDDVPYEQIQTRRPVWLQTVHTQNPFATDPPFLRLDHVPNQAADIWTFDLFHSFHLGVGRNFVGSVLAMYSQLELAGNVEERFELLSDRFRSFCSQSRLGCVLKRITKESIQWPTTGCFPSAGWHKGAVTYALMKFIEHRHLTEDLSADPLLPLAGEACVAANSSIKQMFESGVFLDPDESGSVGGQGMRFLRRYSQLAFEAKEAGRALIIMPKHHSLHKMFLKLIHASEEGRQTLNPITLSVQEDEDFIGKPSRLSRRITSRRPLLVRLMTRYLQAVYDQYVADGFIIRPV